MVKIIKIENQKTASNTINNTNTTIDITIHNTIDTIIPPKPSKSILGISMFGNSPDPLIKLSVLKSLNLGKSLLILAPLYNP